MRHLPYTYRLPIRLAAVLLLFAAVIGALPRSAHAAAITVNTFFTVSKADAQPWLHSSTNYTPKRTMAFPSKTGELYYFIDYSGAVPGSTQFKVRVFDSKNVAIIDGYSHTMRYKDGAYMNGLTGLDNGSYRLTLYVDAEPVTNTNFTIGVHRQGLVVMTFYTVPGGVSFSEGSAPPRTSTFPAGTNAVFFFFRFTGISPDKLVYHLDLHVPQDVGTIDSGPRLTMNQTSNSGSVFDRIGTKNNHPLPPGDYRLNLQVNGVTVASTVFTIHG